MSNSSSLFFLVRSLSRTFDTPKSRNHIIMSIFIVIFFIIISGKEERKKYLKILINHLTVIKRGWATHFSSSILIHSLLFLATNHLTSPSSPPFQVLGHSSITLTNLTISSKFQVRR